MDYFIRTFGCQMNKADSEIIDGLMIAAGHNPKSAINDADLIIINTCAVRERAVERMYGFIRSLRKENKERYPLIAVGGCVSQLKTSEIFTDLPQVDCVFGTTSFEKLPEAASLLAGGARRLNLITKKETVIEGLPVMRAGKIKAWLPVSRGCNNFCSYCVVPYARGREKSRPFESIVVEAESLVADGVKEITLLGQNVNSYGNDFGKTALFASLLLRLDKIKGLRRLRFLTSHPKDLSDATIEAMSSAGSVCEYLHLPLQSGSNRVLAAMRRGYDTGKYLERVKAVRTSIPEISLSTDIIVGFPGESEEDYADTIAVVKEIGFDSAYMFRYSARPGTTAAKLKETISTKEKEARLTRLIELQSVINNNKNRAYIGRKVEIFVEGRSRRDPGRLTGQTRTNKNVNFIGDDDNIGSFVDVKITGATQASLTGDLCG